MNLPCFILAAGVVGALVGCLESPMTPPPASSPPSNTAPLPGLPFPPLDGPAPTCVDHPHLCGLPLKDLGGGDHPDAFQLVFIGDGFPSAGDFAAVVDRFRAELVEDPGGPVTFDPALFHFWRVDLDGPGASTIDDERRDTPLGAFLSPPDSCLLIPFIAVDRGRVDLAVGAARPLDDTPVDLAARGPVHPIVVVAGSTGRANADVSVRISSFDSVGTLRHELGHALFQLADEYVEFDACPKGALIAAANATDGDLVHVPNIQRSTHPAKWQGLSETSEVGGDRVPCLHHAAPCLMGSGADQFCPVCRLAIEERLDLQRCGDDDVEAPRVAIDVPLDAPDLVILPGGSRAVVRAVVDDTRDGGRPIAWVLDGEEIAEGALTTLDLVALSEQVARQGGRSFADATLVARAVDEAGNIGVSRPLLLDEALPGILEAQPTAIGGLEGFIGVRIESVRPFDLVEVKSALETVVVDSGATGTATVTIRVPPGETADLRLVARSADGRLRAAEHALSVTTSTAVAAPPTLAFAAGSDAIPLGEESLLFVEVQACLALLAVGVIFDDGRTHLEPLPPLRGRACTTDAPAPTVRHGIDIDGATTTLTPVVVDVTGRRTLGPPIVVARDDGGADGALQSSMRRARTPFDATAIDVAPADGMTLDDAFGVLAGRVVAFPPAEGVRRGALYAADLGSGDERLRVVATIRRDDGRRVRVRLDVDLTSLLAAVDVRPPVVVTPLHSPRGALWQDVIVADDRDLAVIAVDGVPQVVRGAEATFKVAPGAAITVLDSAGLHTSTVAGGQIPSPRVAVCE